MWNGQLWSNYARGFGPFPRTAEVRGTTLKTLKMRDRQLAYGLRSKRAGEGFEKWKGPLPGKKRPLRDYSCSFRAFLRLRLRAKASLVRRFSPGFR